MGACPGDLLGVMWTSVIGLQRYEIAIPREQLVGARAAFVAGQRLEARLQAHPVLAAGQERVERGLLERGTDHPAHLRAVLVDDEPADPRGARGGRQERGQHQHRRRLPCAVRAQGAVDLARSDDEVDVVDRARALLELPDEALHLDRVLLARRTGPSLRKGFRRPGVSRACASSQRCSRSWPSRGLPPPSSRRSRTAGRRRSSSGMTDSPGGAAALRQRGAVRLPLPVPRRRREHRAGLGDLEPGRLVRHAATTASRGPHGVIPVFTYYQLLQSKPDVPGGEAKTDLAHLDDPATMAAYWARRAAVLPARARHEAGRPPRRARSLGLHRAGATTTTPRRSGGRARRLPRTPPASRRSSSGSATSSRRT